MDKIKADKIEATSEAANHSSPSSPPPSLIGGACIIACICVGAGMLGLPSAGAGAWIAWSLVVLVATMMITILSGCFLLEVLKNYPYGSSFNSITTDLLGKSVSHFNSVLIYFVGAVLLYAYITSSGLLIDQYLGINAKLGSVLFVALFSALVWHSTRAVDRFSIVVMLFMVLSFVLLITGLLFNIDLTMLWQTTDLIQQSPFLFSLIPIAMTAFGYQHAVSTMRDYYRSENKAQKAIVAGVLIALTVYSLWIIAIYGNLPRSSFGEIIREGGNIDALLSGLSAVIETQFIATVISAFSAAAILSSFVGVGLGLFDFLADAFRLPNSNQGRLKTWAITFLPPLLLSLLLPFGFLAVIGFAASASAIWTCVIPAILVRKSRKREAKESATNAYQAFGGNGAIYLVAIFGVSVVAIHIATVTELIPRF